MQSKYQNVYVKEVHVPTMIDGSPMELLWEKKAIQRATYNINNLTFIEFT